jgi:acyl dehydratase
VTRAFTSVQDVRSSVGTTFGPTAPVLFEQDLIDAFAELSGDKQWIHCDPVQAAASQYGGTIAHGLLTLAMIPTFSRQLFTFDYAEARINYGFDRVRYPASVASGSALVAYGTILSVTGDEQAASVTIRYELTVGLGQKPACVADMVLLLRGTPSL